MVTIPKVSVVKLEKETQFAPLVALGFSSRACDVLAPIYSRMEFPAGTHTQEPAEALIDLWISILAGCRSVSQINTKIRPDLPLAAAWGREKFREQSTIARVLNECTDEQVGQLREGVNSLYRWLGQSSNRIWENNPFMVDIDLTGLPAGRLAEGSVAGYNTEKKELD